MALCELRAQLARSGLHWPPATRNGSSRHRNDGGAEVRLRGNSWQLWRTKGRLCGGSEVVGRLVSKREVRRKWHASNMETSRAPLIHTFIYVPPPSFQTCSIMHGRRNLYAPHSYLALYAQKISLIPPFPPFPRFFRAFQRSPAFLI